MRRSSFSFLGFSPVSSHRGGKKKGHVCLEKYVGQWNISCTGTKGEEGSGEGDGEAEWSSGGRSWQQLPPYVPPPGSGREVGGGGAISRFLSTLDPFSGQALFALEETPIIFPQQALRSSPDPRSPPSPRTPASQLLPPSPPPACRSLRNRCGPRAGTRPVPGIWLCAKSGAASTAWKG